MSAHTPGPWRVWYADKRDVCAGTESAPIPVATTWQNNDADVRLIAAAPELLEALCNCITWIDKSDPDYESALISFERTIAKAEGKA